MVTIFICFLSVQDTINYLLSYKKHRNNSELRTNIKTIHLTLSEQLTAQELQEYTKPTEFKLFYGAGTPDEEIILYEMTNITHLTVDIIQLIIVFKMKNT